MHGEVASSCGEIDGRGICLSVYQAQQASAADVKPALAWRADRRDIEMAEPERQSERSM
jgi:hypothetical protein